MSIFEQEITAPVVDADNNPIEDESNAGRSDFISRVERYLANKEAQGFKEVTIRSIQNSFSPEYPDANRIFDALEDLGYAWFKSDEGNVVSLSITDYPSF